MDQGLHFAATAGVPFAGHDGQRLARQSQRAQPVGLILALAIPAQADVIISAALVQPEFV